MEDNIQSIVRVFKILEAFEKFPDGVSLTEISKEVGLHKSTVFRFLNTLSNLGYVSHDYNNKYFLTYKLYSLASIKINKVDLIGVSHDFIKKLSRSVNEVVHLVIADDIYAVYVDKIEGDNTLTLNSRIGKRAPLIYTSVGKSILSNYKDEYIKEIFDKTMDLKLKANKILSFQEFMDQINSSRNTGIAIDDEENEEGIYCIGTTLYNSTANVAGAISITGPKFRIIDKGFNNLKKEILTCANEISKSLGYLEK